MVKKFIKWALIIILGGVLLHILGWVLLPLAIEYEGRDRKNAENALQECLRNDDYQGAHDVLNTNQELWGMTTYENNQKKVYLAELKYLADQNYDEAWQRAVTLIQEYKREKKSDELTEKTEFASLLMDYAITCGNTETPERICKLMDQVIDEANVEIKGLDKENTEYDSYKKIVHKAEAVQKKAGYEREAQEEEETGEEEERPNFIKPVTTAINQYFEVVGHKNGYAFSGNKNGNKTFSVEIRVLKKVQEQFRYGSHTISLYLLDNDEVVLHTLHHGFNIVNKGVGETFYETFEVGEDEDYMTRQALWRGEEYDESYIKKAKQFKIVID